jgi:hypothetical protein
MKMRFLLAATCIVALAACNSNKGNSSAANSSNTGTATSNSAATTDGAGSGNAAGRTVDPALAQEIAMAVQMLKDKLPLKQGEVTVTNIESQGGELIYSMELPKDLDEEKFEQFKQMLPTQACQNPQARQMFERGGSYTYRIKDSEGEEFTTSVSSCS